MVAGSRRDLWQVGDNQNLAGLRHASQRIGDFRTSPATHTLIHLVEHQGLDHVVGGEHHLQGQHDPRQLAAAGNLGQRTRFEALVQLNHKGDLLTSVGAHLIQGPQLGTECCVGHAQFRQPLLHRQRQPLRRILPRSGQRSSRSLELVLSRRPALGNLLEVEIRGVQNVQLATCLVVRRQDVFEGRTILLQEPVDPVAAALYFGEPPGVALD